MKFLSPRLFTIEEEILKLKEDLLNEEEKLLEISWRENLFSIDRTIYSEGSCGIFLCRF